jgi:hypothetical protein
MSGPLETSVTLDDVIAVVAAKRVPLAAELAGYLALEMAEGVGSVAGALDATNVYVSDEGTVALVRSRKDGDAEDSIRSLLAKLLEAGGTQTPALGMAAKKASGAGAAGLARELEGALIPVNRAAGRRALARLAREVKRVRLGVGRNASIPPAERTGRASVPDGRARPSAPSFSEEEPATAAKRAVEPELLPEQPTKKMPTPPPPESEELHPVEEAAKDDVDELLSNFGVSGQKEDKSLARELKAMVGVEPTPPPLGETSEADDASVEDLLSLSREPKVPTGPLPPPRGPTPAGASNRNKTKSSPPGARPSPKKGSGHEGDKDDEVPSVRPPQHSYADERQLPTAPTRRQDVRRRLTVVDVVLGLLLAALIGAGGYLLFLRLRPGIVGPTPTPSAPTGTAPAPPSASAAQQRACKASLTVEGAQEKAEILLRVGQAPVEIDHMPVGTRLEFVATAEGHAPKRAIVPSNASWEKGADGKPRYELAIQLDPSRPKGQDPWPPAEPGSSAGGEGAPGVVRVVSTPKGAEVWLLVGLGPDALIERLPCSGDTQVLVAGTTRKRLVVRESDFAPVAASPGQKAAKVSAK